MDPSIFPLIVLIEHGLIVKLEDSVTDRRSRRRENKMGDIVLVPGSDCIGREETDKKFSGGAQRQGAPDRRGARLSEPVAS